MNARSSFITLAAVALLCLVDLGATAQQTPIRPSTMEPRYIGSDSPAYAIVQALGTSTEAIRDLGTGTPICVNWRAIVVLKSTQRTCWCWVMDPNVTIAADASADGGCRIYDAYGRDGTASCVVTEPNIAEWSWPAWEVVSKRPGARGMPGGVGGLCTVATSTTQAYGTEGQRVPCRVDGDCTTIVGSGTCEDFTSARDSQRADEQIAHGCAYLLALPNASAIATVGGRR